MNRTVCIYSASSDRIAPIYLEAARELGTLLGQQGVRIVNGAGAKGLMAVVAEAALQAGGEVVGVIPRFMVQNGWHHPQLTELIEVETMHERKALMADLADAVIALPGGCGTMEELMEIITWRQLGLYHGEVVILNTAHYYDPLLTMLQRAVDEQFMDERYVGCWSVAESASEASLLVNKQKIEIR